MTKQLPIIHKNNAVTVTTTSNSLLGRGLAAISQTELDIRYRKARDTYNQITGKYDWERHFIFRQADLFENDLLQILKNVFTDFQQLANQGYGKVYFPLAKIYEGKQRTPQNIEKSHYYSQLAFDWCFTNRMLKDSEIWRDLGWMYYNGFGVAQDNNQAVFWYCKAAEQGDAVEQYNLGQMYEDGFGVEQNDEQALFWYEQAAEQGHAEAQYNLGQMYDDGCGVKQNDEQVLFWYEQAAEQGHAQAQYNLGFMYENGLSVEQDIEQSIFWYEQAAEQGHANAQKNLDLLCATIIPSEDYHSQPVLVSRFRVNNTQIDAILKLKSEYQAQLEDILVGQSDDWCVLANDFGYGFKVQLKELQSRYKHGKLQIVFDDAKAALRLVLIRNETDLLAVATALGRLLIFPVNELPVLAHGKSNKIIQLSSDDLAHQNDGVISMTVFSMQQSLKITSGKRFVTLRPADIQHYTSSLGDRGLRLPIGFLRVDALESV